jgi:thiol-disulfide isomerase/thioredoxin
MFSNNKIGSYKVVALGLITFLLLNVNACKTYMHISTDQTTGRKMLLGKTERTELYNDNSFDWFKERYNAYMPDKVAVDKIRGTNQNLTFIVFAGTWCGDTRALLPNFYKVMDAAGVKDDDIELYLLDRSKKSGDGLAAKYHIKFLPTFIVMKDGNEIGRVVETINNSIEQDISEFLGK